MNQELLGTLLNRQLAISTLASIDVQWALRLQDDEFLRWGVGPSLDRGAIVAIYVPKATMSIPQSDRGTIRHIFSVARPTYPESEEVFWHNVVWLHRRVTLDNPLKLEQLKHPTVTQTWRLPNSNFRSVGRLRKPLTAAEAEIFWALVLRNNPSATSQLRQNLLTSAGDTERTSIQSDSPTFEYEVALSFAGEDRETAREIALECKKAGIRVFFDEFETASLLGKDLYQYLAEVYQKKARFCVPILSESYAAKNWTKHELKSAQARAFVESEEYILPLRLDDTEIPGIRGTIGYLDLRSIAINNVVAILKKKLER